MLVGYILGEKDMNKQGIRRVVTGFTPDGRSTIVADGEPPRILTRPDKPGLVVTEIWATHEAVPILPPGEADPTLIGWHYWPEPGETLFRLVRFPPVAELEAAAAAGVELDAVSRESVMKVRGLPDDYNWQGLAMHSTDTIDYGLVLSGEIWMVLQAGEEVLLRAGDCVVQNGTLHGWYNKGDAACLMAFILVGARRQK